MRVRGVRGVRVRGTATVRAGAEDREADAPDGAGDAAAVELELGEVRVGGPDDVHPHPCEQVFERVEGQREALVRVGERRHHRIGVRGRELAQRGAERVEPAQLLRGLERAVADVVDAARVRVDRADCAPLVRGEEDDAVVEVARGGARQRLALAVREAGARRVGVHGALSSADGALVGSRALTSSRAVATSRRAREARGGPASTS